MFGSKEEQKQLQGQYKNECDFQVNLKESRVQGENYRDKLETKRCDDIFQAQCEAERQRVLAQREQTRRVQEENMWLAQNRKKQEQTSHVQECMQHQETITNSKISYSTMIR